MFWKLFRKKGIAYKINSGLRGIWSLTCCIYMHFGSGKPTTVHVNVFSDYLSDLISPSNLISCDQKSTVLQVDKYWHYQSSTILLSVNYIWFHQLFINYKKTGEINETKITSLNALILGIFALDFIMSLLLILCCCDWFNSESMGACNSLQCSKY